MHSPVHLTHGDRETAGQSFRRLGKHFAVGASAFALAGAAIWYSWNWWTVGRFIQWTDDAYLAIQIVTASLQEIGGGVSASQDEIVWVQTSYLIAEIVVSRCPGG